MTSQPSDESRKYRMQLAVRRNEGKRLLPKLLDDFSLALHVNASDLHLADLEATDRIWEAFTTSHHEAGQGITTKSWPTGVFVEAKEYVDELDRQTPDLPMFLFRPFLSEYCGALMTTSHQIFNHAFDLIRLDDDDIMASSEDGISGIIISYSTQKSVDLTQFLYQFTGFGAFSTSK
jgi:hypothetical protein